MLGYELNSFYSTLLQNLLGFSSDILLCLLSFLLLAEARLSDLAQHFNVFYRLIWRILCPCATSEFKNTKTYCSIIVALSESEISKNIPDAKKNICKIMPPLSFNESSRDAENCQEKYPEGSTINI